AREGHAGLRRPSERSDATEELLRRQLRKKRSERAPGVQPPERERPSRRRLRKEEIELGEPSLSRWRGEKRRRRDDLGKRRPVEPESFEPREETGGPEDANGVLEEDSRARRPEAAAREVGEGSWRRVEA